MNSKEEAFVEKYLDNPKNDLSRKELEDIMNIFQRSPNMCRKIVSIYKANGCGKLSLDTAVNPWFKETNDLGIGCKEAKVMLGFLDFIEEEKKQIQRDYYKKHPIWSYELRKYLE